MLDHLGVGHAVQQIDPGDEELPDKLVSGVHPLPQDGNKGLHVKLLALGDDVLQQAVQELRAVLDVLVRVGHHVTDGTEYLVEDGHHVIPGNLGEHN